MTHTPNELNAITPERIDALLHEATREFEGDTRPEMVLTINEVAFLCRTAQKHARLVDKLAAVRTLAGDVAALDVLLRLLGDAS